MPVSRRKHLCHDELRLLRLVLAVDQLRQQAVLAIGPKVLAKALLGLGHDGVRGIEDRLGAAVIPLERDHRRSGKLGRKVQDVPHGGGAEGVNRLGIIADNGQPLPARREAPQDLGLQGVGVLVLVDQDRVEPRANELRRLGLATEGVPVEQQIVVVEDGERLFAVDIGVKEALQGVQVHPAPGKRRIQHIDERLLAVDATAVDVEARPLEREPRLRVA